MSPGITQLLQITRFSASFLALGAALSCLGWLALRLEAVPLVQVRPWEIESAPLVIVDAGHGGVDGGAVAGGLIEKNLSLTLARKLCEHLQKLGLRVKMTRDSDIFIELEERSRIAAELKAALFVSLHLNTSDTAAVSGIETYYAAQKSLAAKRASEVSSSGKNSNEWLARHLQRHVCLETKAEDRGIKAKNYAVVTHTPCPAALIECGFLTNAEEVTRLKQPAYQDKLTAGIANGVAEFLKTQLLVKSVPPSLMTHPENESEVKIETQQP